MYNTTKKLNGTIDLKGDKSISHRLLMIASLINDKNNIKNLSQCEDVLTTIKCLQECNIYIDHTENLTTIIGGTLKSPSISLDCKNSGTTIRMLMGLLAGQKINSSFRGDTSLMKRPMKRIINPLGAMSINIKHTNNMLPISIDTDDIEPINYKQQTKSAQVKSSLMLASLGSNKYSSIAYNKNTRDHTEKILKYLKFDISVKETIKIRKSNIEKGFSLTIPGDISNASFIIGAGIIIPNSKIIIKNVLYNKTRLGFINTLLKMGANITVIKKERNQNPENFCDIIVKYTPKLQGITISGDTIITMIDEIPIFSIVATQAIGQTILKDAADLRNKESDRLSLIYTNLLSMGASIIEQPDGLIINGGKKLYNTSIKHGNDHRIAMSFEVLNLLINNKMDKSHRDTIKISFPEFYDLMEDLII